MTTYPKQLHVFPKDEFKNPDGPTTAWVYNGINDPVEPYANYIIEYLHDTDEFMLVLENDSFIERNLADLEPRLFAWMEGEGVVAIPTRKDNNMTTEQFHEELRKCGFYKVGTGGGCDALVKSFIGRRDIEVMLTAFEDAAVPEADDQVHITIRFEGDTEAWFVLSPEQTLAFAKSLTTNETK